VPERSAAAPDGVPPPRLSSIHEDPVLRILEEDHDRLIEALGT